MSGAGRRCRRSQLLKSQLLIAFFSVRSDRLFCEQLAYKFLFRWFLDLAPEATPVRPKVLEALARTKYTTLVDVYDYVDVEEMRRYVERNGDQRTETATQQR